MKKKILIFLNITVFFVIVILPFYTNFNFLKLYLSYLFSFFWFLMIALIGIKSGLAYFLFASYITFLFVFLSFIIDTNVILGSVIGPISACMFYLSRIINNE